MKFLAKLSCWSVDCRGGRHIGVSTPSKSRYGKVFRRSLFVDVPHGPQGRSVARLLERMALIT